MNHHAEWDCPSCGRPTRNEHPDGVCSQCEKRTRAVSDPKIPLSLPNVVVPTHETKERLIYLWIHEMDLERLLVLFYTLRDRIAELEV